jgi:hypothetical protein
LILSDLPDDYELGNALVIFRDPAALGRACGIGITFK